MRKIVLALVMGLLLIGCAGQVDRSSVQRKLDWLRTGYLVAGLTVATYSALPPCTDKVTVGCSNLEAAAKARAAIGVLGEAIDSAQMVLASASADVTSTEKTLAVAEVALAALTKILNEYRISRGQG